MQQESVSWSQRPSSPCQGLESRLAQHLASIQQVPDTRQVLPVGSLTASSSLDSLESSHPGTRGQSWVAVGHEGGSAGGSGDRLDSPGPFGVLGWEHALSEF